MTAPESSDYGSDQQFDIEIVPDKKKSRKGKFLIILLLLMGLFLGWKLKIFEKIARLNEPFDTKAFLEPYSDISQNGYINYLKGDELLVDFRDLDYPGQKADLNSFCASDVLSEFHSAKLGTSYNWNDAKPLIKKYLELNQPALAEFHLGTQKPFSIYESPGGSEKHLNLQQNLQAPKWPIPFETHFIWDGWHLTLLQATRLSSLGEYDASWKYHKSLFQLESQYSHRTMPDLGTWYYQKLRNFHDNEIKLAVFLANTDLTAPQLRRYYLELKEIYDSIAPPAVRKRWAYFYGYEPYESFWGNDLLGSMSFHEEETQELYDEFQFNLIAIALHCYYREKGKFPDRLEELIPNYMEEIPQNPLKPSIPIKYERKYYGLRIGRGEYWDLNILEPGKSSTCPP